MSNHVTWKKAGYGGTTGKKGGGKLHPTNTGGDKGIGPATGNISTGKITKDKADWIDAPGNKGDMGTSDAKASASKGYSSKKAAKKD